MKWLYLKEILAHIGGVLVQGDGNPLIKNVVTKRYKIDSHTLLFDLYRRAEIDSKSTEHYLKAKAEILHDLEPVNDTLIINADDENINKIDGSKFRNILIYFGLTDGCHFQATDVTYGQGGMQFALIKVIQSLYPALANITFTMLLPPSQPHVAQAWV